jgi:predicted nucleic acid-binding Zn ribbon protein
LDKECAGRGNPARFLFAPPHPALYLDTEKGSLYSVGMGAFTKYPRQARVQPGSVADGGLPLSKLIAPLLKSVKLDEQCRMGILEEKWEMAVGKGMASHTRPGVLAGKALTIYVDSSPWLSELFRMQKDILVKLQRTFGRDVIQSIRLQLDPGKP